MGRTRKTREAIHALFYPRSVAVIGANAVRGTVPFDIFNNILKDDFQGVLYPVSPRESSICSVKAYKYVIDIPDDVDMGVLVFPSSVASLAMKQCGEKGIRSMIIISAGFREVGEKGLEREKEIKAIAEEYGISFIGPNCLGVINTDPLSRFNASFARKMPEQGNIAFLSQSGALCTAVLDYAQARKIGFSKFVSFGNKADVDEIDLMMYLKDDPQTDVILLYLEEITDGRALMDAARQITRETGKPILALKSGRTSAGAAAAASHTGSLAGSDDICDAAFAQAGIIRCDDIEQMFNYATAFAWKPVPKGSRTAIVTNAGGPGVLATDMAIAQGLDLARFSEATTKILKKDLPATANIKNPVDVIGDARADRYDSAIRAVLEDDGTDSACVILTPQSMTDIETIAQGIVSVSEAFDKPLYTSFMGEADVAAGIRILLEHHIPHYNIPEDMCRAMAVTSAFGRDRTENHPEPAASADAPAFVTDYIDGFRKAGQTSLTEAETLPILEAFGLPVLPHGFAARRDELVAAMEKSGFPLAMKVMSHQLLHKSDSGGVILNLNDPEEVFKAWDRVTAALANSHPEAVIDGFLLEKMADPGQELILGIKRDPSFGPVVMAGLGGIFVEIFRDVAFRVAPLSDRDARDMIRNLKGYKLLTGARGRKAADIESLEKILLNVARMAAALPQIAELDINPLILAEEGQGAAVADARIILNS